MRPGGFDLVAPGLLSRNVPQAANGVVNCPKRYSIAPKYRAASSSSSKPGLLSDGRLGKVFAKLLYIVREAVDIIRNQGARAKLPRGVLRRLLLFATA